MNAFLTLFLFLAPIFYFLVRRRRTQQKLPPGSLGPPIIGQSLSFLRALRANTAETWLEERVRKYGPISKLNLLGKPTVFVCGQAANKFVFASNSKNLSSQKAQSVRRILGDRNLFELTGEDHKRVRDALVSFLKPECLKEYVGKMDGEVRRHLEMHWQGKENVTVLPLMKTLTFDIICFLLFGIESGAKRDELVKWFETMIEGMWSVPINLPFTRYNRSLRASAIIRSMVKDLIREKKFQLEHKGTTSHQDLITCLLSIRGKNNEQVMSEDEIVQNVMLVMVAGHDTSSILITFIIRFLAIDPAIYATVVQEQEEIAKGKKSGEPLTWEDLTQMKYTWKVALEVLRLFPPIFGGFKKTLRDVEYGGYLIPKGWQVYWVTMMTHMDGNIFQEPSKFDPERFENRGTIPPFCYVPFGGGPSMCPGIEFARIETLISIHYLVTCFTWKLCSSDNDFGRDPMPVPKQGLPIQIVPKKPV